MSLITPSMLREYATSLIIDPESRTIQIPKDFLLGVYNDKDVKYVPFVIPRFYEENDFGDFSIQVNYIDADKNTDAYLVTDPVVEDQVVRFNWILGRGVFLSHGTIFFIVCFRIADQQGNITKEFNTTIHSATVLEGLEVEETIDPEAYSILANIQGLEASASAARNQAVQQATLAAAHEQAIEQMLVDTPRFASSISDMTDTSQLYIYSGNEAGFQLGAWYYYNTDHAAWELYGNLNTDTTLSVSGMSADGKATGDALALKANISDVNVALTAKADASDVEDALALKADASDVTSSLAGKVDKVTGKQLSTEDFTSAFKTKLEGIAAGATNVTVDSSMSSTSTNPVQNKVINTALGTKLATTGDSKDLTTTFTSSDVADGSASAWTSVGALANTEKHSSIFAKVSQMFKNVRYLFKMLGTTDISSIGNGTVSGALSTLNNNSIWQIGKEISSTGTDLNNYTTPGLYYVPILNGVANTPTTATSSAGNLYVFYRASNARVFQVLLAYNPTANQTVGIYTRVMTGANSWSDWKEYADQSKKVESLHANSLDELSSIIVGAPTNKNFISFSSTVGNALFGVTSVGKGFYMKMDTACCDIIAYLGYTSTAFVCRYNFVDKTIVDTATMLPTRGEVDQLKTNTISEKQTYTPTFTWRSSTATESASVSNISSSYYRFGKMMIVNIRFNLTDVGTTNNMNLYISLPSQFEYYLITPATAGVVHSDTKPSKDLSVRVMETEKAIGIVSGPGGGYARPVFTTGFHGVFCMVLIK